MKHGEVEKMCFEAVMCEMQKGKCFYGFSVEDDSAIEQLFNSAKPNPNPSAFPDFICDNGFIEHFQVTSSHSNRNGSTMKCEQYALRQEAERKENALMEEMNSCPCYEGKTVMTDAWHGGHTYEDFCSSFKRSWERHIHSMGKNAGDKTTAVFMIQYDDSALKTDINCSELKEGICYGDLLKKPEYSGYRLTYDSKLLEYIYQFKDKVQYVAFCNKDCFNGKKCEIICVENIPELLKIVSGKYSFHCATIGTSHMIQGISIPCTSKERNEKA